MISCCLIGCLLFSLTYFGESSFLINSSNYTDYLYLLGRLEPSKLVGSWPGTGIRFILDGSNSKEIIHLTFKFSDVEQSEYYIRVLIDDCEYENGYLINENSQSIQISLNLLGNMKGNFNRIVDLIRVTESNYSSAHGIMKIDSVYVSDGGVILPYNFAIQRYYKELATPSHKILFIGDSITAAYGVDGTDPCDFTTMTENIFHSYATLLAKTLNNSEVHIVAWSGKGVVRNYGDSNQVSIYPMPYYYNLTIATDSSSYWDPSYYAADIIVVMLGSNDYSTNPNPTDEQFTTGLSDLLNRIHSDYDRATVFAMCAPISHGNQCSNIEAAASKTKSHYIRVDPSTYDGGYGCNGHPNIATQQNIAKIVATEIIKVLD
eukprot:gene15404-20779_t